MKLYPLFFAFFCCLNLSYAQNQHALIIGIDTYKPLGANKSSANGRIDFKNLDGCKNDALAVKSLIQSYYAFKTNNIDTLYNRNATRDNILLKFNALLNKSNAGDIAFIYYAGHGSQQKNSLSKETDHLDESIVPSDTWKPGVGDIRDKELAKLFNAFIDKGVKLTVILDCCHSGSMSRGLYSKPKSRYIATNNFDAKDASNPPAPETRKEGSFLIISAAQDDEPAEEAIDDNKKPHGAFTIALLEAIKQQSVNASAINIFKSIGVILKSKGKSQEPVIAGDIDRQNQTLFGIAKGKLSDKIMVPVLAVEKDLIQIQGGFAESFLKGQQLTATADSTLVLQILSVDGISQSTAKIIKGNIKKIKPGLLFYVSNWVASGGPLLNVYIPKSNFTPAQVDQFATLCANLKKADSTKFINNFYTQDPDVYAYFIGDKLQANIDRKTIEDISTIDLATLQKTFGSKTVFFNLPTSHKINESLIKAFSINKSIALVNTPEDAHYVVYGTISDDGKPAYGLMAVQASRKDSLAAMPIQTKYFTIENNSPESLDYVADNIYDLAKSLTKVKGWMTLASPVADNNIFPFSMQFFDVKTKQNVTQTKVKIDDAISLKLVADSNFLTLPFVPQKYIYIFTIDKFGAMQLAYPNARTGSVENKFPKDNTKKVYDMLSFKITEPVGVDSFYLLASDTPIPGYAVLFNQKGTRGPKDRKKMHALDNVLNIGNDNSLGATRGIGFETPANWNLLRVELKSTK
jgi:hypothetical protein